MKEKKLGLNISQYFESVNISSCMLISNMKERITINLALIIFPQVNLSVCLARLNIPKGYSSERFLFRKLFIPKSFISKSHYSKIRNYDSSELKSSE